MPSIHARLDLLRRLRRPLRHAALAAALRAATPEEADDLVAEILERDHGGSSPPHSTGHLALILANWPRLSPEARRATLAAAAERLPDVLATLPARADPPARQAPILILADLAEKRLPTPGSLADPAPLTHLGVAALTPDDLAQPAPVEALARVALDLIPSHEPPETPLDLELDRALADAARHYEHHRSALLMDAILRRAAHPGPALGAWLDDDTEPGHLALRAGVRRMPRDLAARSLVSLLAVGPIAGACVERLERLDDPDACLRLMLDAPLLETRGRRDALRKVTRPDRILPGADHLASMPLRARLGFVRWVDALPLKPERRLEHLAISAADADPRVRLAALRAIERLTPTPSLDEVLAQLAADADERVATAAAGALASARSEHRRTAIASLAAPLLDSPHPGVREIIRSLVAPAGPGDPEGRPVWTSPVLARAALGRAPNETLADLRAQIASADRPARLAALTIGARLGIVHLLRDQVLAAAHDDDPYVAAKAARALGTLRRSETRDDLARLVEHKDARVRADAIEALGTWGDVRALDLTALSRHPTPRIRANTLRAMLSDPDQTTSARAALAEMLADTRPEHRRSALWVVQRCALTPLAERVAEIVRFDPDQPTRDRARRCATRLLAEMRRSWTARVSAEPAQELSTP